MRDLTAAEIRALALRLQGPLRTLLAPGHVRAVSNNGQNISNNTLQTVIFEDEERDDDDEYNPATGELTTKRGGALHISSGILFATTTGWANTEIAYLTVYVSGTEKDNLDFKQNEGSQNHYVKLTGSTTLEVAEGDVVTVRCYQNSGGARALHNDNAYNYVAFDWLP